MVLAGLGRRSFSGWLYREGGWDHFYDSVGAGQGVRYEPSSSTMEEELAGGPVSFQGNR